jgi:hypothetical protein
VAGSLTIKESDKVNTPSTDVFRIAGGSSGELRTTAIVFEDPTKGQGLRLKLKTVDEDRTMAVLDEVFVSYKATYSNEVDQWDAVKATNMGENLGVLTEGQTLAIERKPLPKESDVIALKLWNTKEQTYALEVNPVNLGGTGLTAFVEDRYLKTSTPISLDKPSQVFFTITGDAASATSSRFQIILSRKVTDDLTRVPGKPSITAFPNPVSGGTLSLLFSNQAAGSYQVTVRNSLGQVVFQKAIQHGGSTSTQTLPLGKKLAKGVYQLQVSSKEGVTNLPIISN